MQNGNQLRQPEAAIETAIEEAKRKVRGSKDIKKGSYYPLKS